MTITISSAKAKGRRLQQTVRDAILKLFPSLQPDDVRSCAMGSNGEDIQMSPAARALMPYAIECKARASHTVYKDLDQAAYHASKCLTKATPLVILKSDRRKPLAVVDLDHFMGLVEKSQTPAGRSKASPPGQ